MVIDPEAELAGVTDPDARRVILARIRATERRLAKAAKRRGASQKASPVSPRKRKKKARLWGERDLRSKLPQILIANPFLSPAQVLGLIHHRLFRPKTSGLTGDERAADFARRFPCDVWEELRLPIRKQLGVYARTEGNAAILPDLYFQAAERLGIRPNRIVAAVAEEHRTARNIVLNCPQGLLQLGVRPLADAPTGFPSAKFGGTWVLFPCWGHFPYYRYREILGVNAPDLTDWSWFGLEEAEAIVG